jgi:hypothetical protein
MKKTLTTREVANELLYDKNAGWSRFGALALAEYLADIEQEICEEMELDVVAIRCDYSEHGSLLDWALDYFGGESCALESLPDLEDESIRDYILDRATLIEFDGGIIVSNF